jgi:hypothetical protein
MENRIYIMMVKKVKNIITSNQTAFEIKLLEWLDINIVRNTMTFSGFSDSYNDFHNENKNNDIVIIKYLFSNF